MEALDLHSRRSVAARLSYRLRQILVHRDQRLVNAMNNLPAFGLYALINGLFRFYQFAGNGHKTAINMKCETFPYSIGIFVSIFDKT